jgi:hypothetical protein
MIDNRLMTASPDPDGERCPPEFRGGMDIGDYAMTELIISSSLDLATAPTT